MDGALVGRDEEVRTLLGWWAEARDGSPRVVLLGGEPGIGKTRIAHELTEQVAADGTTTAWGRGTEQEGAPPFWPWRQVLGRLGGADALADAAGVDPEVERFARFEAVVATLDQAAGDSGVLIVVDDVHQIDAGSLRLLVHLADALHGPVLIVATHRTSPADHAPGFADTVEQLLRLPVTRQLVLTGLDPAAVAALLEVDPSNPLAASAAEGTGGNPLLLAELARHLRAGHDPSSVPASVREAVRRRLAARSPECARTLEVAAIIGREFDAGLVATATGEPALASLQAIDEAIGAGLVEPADGPGRFRFVHALVRDAVEATLGAASLPARHRVVAEAVATYHGSGDEVLPELARHWSVAAALGGREVAAGWCERAADSADRRMAWEEAARLYERAAELTGADVDPDVRYRRLLGAARARFQCDEMVVAVERVVAAAEAVRHLDRPRDIAEACLLAEGRGGPMMLPLLGLAEEALVDIDADDHAVRARLLGLIAAIAFYVDPGRVEERSLAALAEADLADDPLADVAAARARQMALIEPLHAEERLELAARIGRAGRALGRPSITQWESIWRIDALLELGRLPEALAELTVLRQHVESVGLPMSRWHLLRVEAALAQATGRFAEATVWSEQAAELFGRLEEPLAGRAMHLGFLVMVHLHTGDDPAFGRDLLAIPHELAPLFLGDLPRMQPIIGHLCLGDLESARTLYDQLAPADAWSTPPFLRLNLHILRLWLATRLGRSDDLPPLLAVIEEHRGVHAGTSAGGVSYMGPVELWLGTGRAALGEIDAAIEDLRAGLAATSANGARGFAVQAATELATALTRRGDAGDSTEAAALARTWRPDAQALGMEPWLARLDFGATADPGPLSARELEVAALVARGMTNKQIAAELFLSERTAQNHVQHILTKLGVANRTQIVSWFQGRG